MTLKEITEAFQWLKNNGKRKITKEEKEWAKKAVDDADTINDLVNVVLEFTKM